MISVNEARQEALKNKESKVKRELEDINKEICKAASRGEFSIEYDYMISKEIQKQLKSMGYKVKERTVLACLGFADVCCCYYIISWR